MTNLILLMALLFLSSCNVIDIHITRAHLSTALGPDLSYAGPAATTGDVGAAMSVSPIVKEGVTSCSISPALPAWATFNPLTCVISGLRMRF